MDNPPLHTHASNSGWQKALERIKDCHRNQARSLDLSDLALTSIPSEVSTLTHLAELNLMNNSISKIENLESLSKLTWLDLSRNAIPKIENLESLSKLTVLYLLGNSIPKIENLESLSQLTELNLSDNSIFKIENLETLSQLTRLDLDHNKISKIENLESLSQLTGLYLSGNSIPKIENLESLSQLTVLNLSYNSISKIENLESLSKLTGLYLLGNSIPKIENLESLSQLTRLDLSRNNIPKIENLEALSQLIELSLNSNSIPKIENLEALSQLTKLDLSHNSIPKIENLEALSQLIELSLNSNSIPKIENLEALSQLTKLDLSHNSIPKIENLEALSQLTELNLWGNSIPKIENLEALSQLTKLDLSRNSISKIENLDTLTQLNLRYLNISENPSLDDELAKHNIELKQGYGENHLEQIQLFMSIAGSANDQKVTLPVQVCFVGNHAVGKSSLMYYIQKNKLPRKKTSSTHVLQISPYSAQNNTQASPEETPELPAAMLFDFGGQDFYHGVYRAFIGSLAKKILVYNPIQKNNRVGEQTNSTKTIQELRTVYFTPQYWLHQLVQLGRSDQEANDEAHKEPASKPDDDILLVQSHATHETHPTPPPVLPKGLSLFAPEHHLCLSSKAIAPASNAKALDYFKATFEAWIAKHRAGRTHRYKPWYVELINHVYAQHQTDSPDKAQPKNVHELAKQFGQTNNFTNFKTALKQSNNSGLVLYDEKIAEGEWVWLNPEAAIAQIHQTLLSARKLKKFKGRIPETEFEELTVDDKVKDLLGFHQVIFYHRPDDQDKTKNEYILPNYLPLACEDQEFKWFELWNAQVSFTLHFAYFVPLGLINHLVCTFGGEPDFKRFWRDQLVFTFERQFQVRIRLDFEHLNVEVFIHPVQQPKKTTNGLNLNSLSKYIFYCLRAFYGGKRAEEVVEFDAFLEVLNLDKANVKRYPPLHITQSEIEATPKSSDSILPRDELEVFAAYEVFTSPKYHPDDLWVSHDGVHFASYSSLRKLTGDDNLGGRQDKHKDTPAYIEVRVKSETTTQKSDNPPDNDPQNQPTQELQPFLSPIIRNIPIKPFDIFVKEDLKAMKKIFISYSKKDYGFTQELRTHLRLLQRLQLTSDWSDEDLGPGNWNDDIQRELDEAEIVVFMLSAYFFSSDYILREEVIKTLTQPSKKIVCVLVRDFAYDLIGKFSQNNASLHDAFTSLTQSEKDCSALTELADQVIFPYEIKSKVESSQDTQKYLLPLEEWKHPAKAYKQIIEQISKLL